MFQDGDGTCQLHRSFDCPPPEEGMTCNPPPPEQIACPSLSRTDSITRLADSTCQASGAFECPDDWDCPDGLIPVDCPPQLTEGTISVNHPYGCVITNGTEHTLTADCPPSMQRPISPDYRIEANDNGICTAWFTGDSHCPEGASCNPPPPADVPGPPPDRPKTINPPPPPG